MVKVLYYSKNTGELFCYEEAELIVAKEKQKHFNSELVKVEIQVEEKKYLSNNFMSV